MLRSLSKGLEILKETSLHMVERINIITIEDSEWIFHLAYLLSLPTSVQSFERAKVMDVKEACKQPTKEWRIFFTELIFFFSSKRDLVMLFCMFINSFFLCMRSTSKESILIEGISLKRMLWFAC